MTPFGRPEPVTAKLSRKFYERLGDDIANELVDWFNAVDATYQVQLREYNDLNWQRVEARMTAFEARVEARLAAVEAQLGALEERINARLESRIQRLRTELIMWMFGFWTATVVPLVALILAVSKS